MEAWQGGLRLYIPSTHVPSLAIEPTTPQHNSIQTTSYLSIDLGDSLSSSQLSKGLVPELVVGHTGAGYWNGHPTIQLAGFHLLSHTLTTPLSTILSTDFHLSSHTSATSLSTILQTDFHLSISFHSQFISE